MNTRQDEVIEALRRELRNYKFIFDEQLECDVNTPLSCEDLGIDRFYWCKACCNRWYIYNV